MAGKVVNCMGVDLLHPRRKWVVWGCGGMSSTSLFGVDQAVLYYWHCLWTSWRMGLLEEQGDAVVGVFLPHPFRSGPLSILNAHFRL